MTTVGQKQTLDIRRASLRHATLLNRLFMQSLHEDFSYFSSSYQATLADQHTAWRFARALASPESIFFVVKAPQGRTVGYNLIRRDSATSAFLHWMYLHPSCRGQGHGAELVRTALATLEQRGVKSLRLVTHNKPTFYEQLGFVRLSTVPIRLGGVDMCLMEYRFDDDNE